MNTERYNKFGFIVHCRNTKELRLALLRFHFSPVGLFNEKALKSYCLTKGFIDQDFSFNRIVSDKHAVCKGRSYCILLTPDQFLEYQVVAAELVKKACEMAKDWGAEIVGLGAITAVVGSRGIEVANNSPVPVTTGNSLTVYASIFTFESIVDRLDIDLSKHKIVIIGFPGSIALALTKILYAKGLNLILVSRRKTAFIDRFIKELPEGNNSIEITQDIQSALSKGLIAFSATSTGQVIDPNLLRPGSIIFDIAQPRDVMYRKNLRSDILIIDAGTVAFPKATKEHYRFGGWGVNDIPSCLAETITLTFENRWENYSIGRLLYPDKINEIGRLSTEHGFIFDKFRSFRKPISREAFKQTKNALRSAKS